MPFKTLQIIALMLVFCGISNIAHAKKSPKITEFIFVMSDKNQDGKVTWKEARQSDGELTKDQFDMIDANGDGHITLSEYEEHVKKYNEQ